MFGDPEIGKVKFHYSRYPIDMNNVDIDKIIISIKVSFGKEDFKYLIVYKNHEKAKSLCIMLPKMNGYAKSFDETKGLII